MESAMNAKTQSPEWLFHYTSIDTLALILRNKTLRLRRLDLMDDPNEAMTNDLGDAGMYVLASSWTASEDEHLLFWKMYTATSGVRIRLPANPFDETHTIKSTDLPKALTMESETFHSCLSVDQIISNDHLIVPMLPRLEKVIYTDDESLLSPNIVHENSLHFVIALNPVGSHKSLMWEFQEEWRY